MEEKQKGTFASKDRSANAKKTSYKRNYRKRL